MMSLWLIAALALVGLIIGAFLWFSRFFQAIVFDEFEKLSRSQNLNENPMTSAHGAFPRWMQDNATHIRHRELRQVYLPGTHDSATHTMHENSVFPAHRSRFLHKVLNCDITGLIGAGVLALAPCQSRPILQQLRDGIRFLDLRIAHVPNAKVKTKSDAGDLIHDVILTICLSTFDMIESLRQVSNNPFSSRHITLHRSV